MGNRSDILTVKPKLLMFTLVTVSSTEMRDHPAINQVISFETTFCAMLYSFYVYFGLRKKMKHKIGNPYSSNGSYGLYITQVYPYFTSFGNGEHISTRCLPNSISRSVKVQIFRSLYCQRWKVNDIFPDIIFFNHVRDIIDIVKLLFVFNFFALRFMYDKNIFRVFFSQRWKEKRLLFTWLQYVKYVHACYRWHLS